MNDEKLTALYDEWIRPMEDRMMRTIWRIVRDAEDAEDTLQDALTLVWRKLERVRSHPNPQALILKICIDTAYDTLRRRKRGQRHEEPDVAPLMPIRVEDRASENIVRKEMESEVMNAIARLPRKQAVAVLMRIVQDEPYATIARVLECSETTVRIHVSRARARLGQWLAHLAPSHSLQSHPREVPA